MDSSATYNPIVPDLRRKESSSSTEINENDSKPPGCLVSIDDYPHILGSCACFITFLVYGACLGCLGAALPSLAIRFDKSEEQFGLAFTTRGIGYFFGTIASAGIIEIKSIKIPLLHLTCASILLVGLASGGLALASEYHVALGIFGIQGIGAGGVDTFGNCYLPQVWGKRVGPWMQCMHSFFGFGAIVGPTLVGSVGYIETFSILCVLSFIPGCIVLIYDSMTTIKTCLSISDTSSLSVVNIQNEPARKLRRRLEGYGKLSQSNKDENSYDYSIEEQDRRSDNRKHKDDDDDIGIELLPGDQIKSDNNDYKSSSSNNADRKSVSINNEVTNDNKNQSNDDEDDMEVIHLSTRTDQAHLINKVDEETGNTIIQDEQEEGEEDERVVPDAPVPTGVRTLLLIFFAVYVGIETSYGGWITTFALEQNVTASRENAAYVASAYWSALTAGRVMAIPLAVYVSTTRMMRIQLSMCVVSSLLVFFLAAINYNCIIFVSICFGYSLSSMFPLAMTLPTDYGYTLDPTTTTLFVVGATLGEGIFPIAVGFLMDAFGSSALTYSMVIFSVSIAALYTSAHIYALKNLPQRDHLALPTS